MLAHAAPLAHTAQRRALFEAHMVAPGLEPFPPALASYPGPEGTAQARQALEASSVAAVSSASQQQQPPPRQSYALPALAAATTAGVAAAIAIFAAPQLSADHVNSSKYIEISYDRAR